MIPLTHLARGLAFYMTATKEPWAKHYKMDSYIIEELMALVPKIAPVAKGKASITGHSMGGHGALTLAMKHPNLFQSVSALRSNCGANKGALGTRYLSSLFGRG